MLDRHSGGVCPLLNLRWLFSQWLSSDVSLVPPPSTVMSSSSLSFTSRPHLTGQLLSSSKYSLHFTAWAPRYGFSFSLSSWSFSVPFAGSSFPHALVGHLRALVALLYVRPHLKCPLYEDVCIYICHLDLSRRLQTRAFDCLLDISICMCPIGISNITCPWDPSRLLTCLFPWALVSRGPLLGDCFRGVAQGVVGVKELLEAERGERRQSGSKVAWVIA